MSVGIFHEDYSGFFPAYIGDITEQLATSVPGNRVIFIPFSLYSLTRLYWLAKSVTVTANLAYSLSSPAAPDGEGAFTDSGATTGSFTQLVFPNAANTASIPPPMRAGFEILPQIPLAYGTVSATLSSTGTANFIPPPTMAPIHYTSANYLNLYFMPLTFESDDGIKSLVGVDDSGQYYLCASDLYPFSLIIGGNDGVAAYLLAISPTSIVGPQGQPAIQTGATLQLSIGSESVSLPLYTNYGSIATITGTLYVAFDTFFTTLTG